MTEPPRPARFPWTQMLALGLGQLRLAPHQFWQMTPKELLAAAGPLTAHVGAGPLQRADLRTLMTLYPDTPHD